MPPGNVVDPWLAGRRFGIVIDAGSSGSRLQIYSWKDPHMVLSEKGPEVSQHLPKVEKGTREGDGWVTRIQPGLSSYADDPESVVSHLAPLLSHAQDIIPPSLHHETPLFLLATAGMRLLTPEQQASVLLHTCHFFRHHSHFRIEPSSDAGPCGTSVRIITGEEEGLFGWIAVNYLMDGFTGVNAEATTYGFLDMGGASTQIAFEPRKAHQGDTKNLIDVRLRLLGGEEIHHRVFVTTWLGYGTNQARERYVGKAISDYEINHNTSKSDTIPDPCLPKNLELIERPVHVGSSTPHTRKLHKLIGTGSFEQCMKQTSSLLNKHAPCPDAPCLMNGIHVPPIDFSVSQFIGISEYWYSSEHVFGLGGPYDFVQYERAASNFCSRDWPGIVKEHEHSRARQRLGGDGEVLQEDGQVISVGKWGPEVELSRLEMQCFKAAWIANILHEGIGLPRLVDPGGNDTTHGEKVAAEAERKGLGRDRPTFQSADSISDIAISWTLGKMVLEASKEVPPLKSAKPLVDPVDDIPNLDESPIKPIRPPFWRFEALEDTLSQHLPESLHRSSLGFSPLLFVVYMTFVVIIVLVSHRLRRRMRIPCLQLLRRISRADTNAYSMEEGKSIIILNDQLPSRTTPPKTFKWLYPLRRVVPAPFLQSRSPHSAPPRPFPTSSQSVPDDLFHIVTTGVETPSSPRTSISRSCSPSPLSGKLEESQSLYNLSLMSNGVSSRSRNTSQMNLSSLVPRQASLASSRLNGIHHPAGSSYQGE